MLRFACAALAVAILGASLVPCPRTEATPTASPGEVAHVAEHAEAGQHAQGCRQAPRPRLSQSCPCGCGDREPASPMGRLGYALLPYVLGLPAYPTTRPAFVVTARLADISPRAIDHVPLAV